MSCSRHRAGCTRCQSLSLDCVYSRAGVIRRPNRKRKHENSVGSRSEHSKTVSDTNIQHSIPYSSKPHIVDDIEAAHQQLRAKTLGSQQHALGALSRLSEAYESTWQDGFDPSKPVENEYFLFESQAAQWTESGADLQSRAECG